MMQRGDIDTIVSWVPEGGKVLDLGCGDGELLHRLQNEKRIEGLGVDIDPANIIAAVSKGLCVVQQDMEDGLQNPETPCFVFAVIRLYSLYFAVDSVGDSIEPLCVLSSLCCVCSQ